eukprot:Phypoly_transcript_23508.p1 GENE.Phypoly_transcript_23508~~Phypoly_transcript_23508.p1  ORF type:complete len:116 (-),score=14.83 Phypoly_transcript_23508:91-438(-)
MERGKEEKGEGKGRKRKKDNYVIHPAKMLSMFPSYALRSDTASSFGMAMISIRVVIFSSVTISASFFSSLDSCGFSSWGMSAVFSSSMLKNCSKNIWIEISPHQACSFGDQQHLS